MSSTLVPPFHPAFEARMKDQLSESYSDFIAAHTTVPPVSIHLHPHKSLPSSDLRKLEPVPWSNFGKYIFPRPIFTLDPAFHAGAYYVQEASSMLIEAAVQQTLKSVSHDPLVLDLCAAPGGKSTLLLSILDRRGLLISNETIQSRVPPLEHNITKWGYSNQIITSFDPQRLEALSGYFDLIMIDAPCSGEGLFRKDPSSRKVWSPEIAHQCVLRQQRILHQASSAVKPGGFIIYSTCTFNPQENIDQLRHLSSYGFDSLPIPELEKYGQLIKLEHSHTIGYQIYPHLSRGEGFFISLMQRNVSSAKNILPSRSLDWATPPSDALAFVQAHHHSWLIHNNTYHLFPHGQEQNLETLSQAVRIIRAGTPIGQLKYGEFVPDHALSPSLDLHPDCASIQFDRQTAIEYLKKNSIPNPEGHKGYCVAKFEDLGLGWVKAVTGRMNNLYPQQYRIKGNFD